MDLGTRTLAVGLLAASLVLPATARAQQTPPSDPPEQGGSPEQAAPGPLPAQQPEAVMAPQGDQRLPAPRDGQVEQGDPNAAPPIGHISSIDGTVTLERANQAEDIAVGVPLLVGDRLRTDNASADITWADSSVLRLARFTEVDVLSPRMVRVPRGTLTVLMTVLPGESASEQLSVDAPGASVRFFGAGRYRLSVNGNDDPIVELAVVEGSAQLVSDQGQITLNAGEKSSVQGGTAPTASAELTATVNDASSYDYSADVAAFQRSSGNAYASTQYLPTELYGYADVLDNAGTWETDATYGYVWYPRVAADWRPYYRGQWRYYRPWGWTWVGTDRWSWPTHHYGRWGVSARGWYWIPARRWGPAWVSWAIAPDYVGWCPLGWDGRPVYGFAYTSVGRGGPHASPWRGWTVLSSQRFAYHDVARYRVSQDVLMRDRPSFITQTRAPLAVAPRGYAVPRGSAIAGRPGYASPVAGAPRETTPYDRARDAMERRAARGGEDVPRRVPNASVNTPAVTGPVAGANGSASPSIGAVPRGQAVPRGPISPNSGASSGTPGRWRLQTPGMSGPPALDRSPGMSRPPQWDRGPGMSQPPRWQRVPSPVSPTASGVARPPSSVSSPAARPGMSTPPANQAIPRVAAPPPPPPRQDPPPSNNSNGGGRRHP